MRPFDVVHYLLRRFRCAVMQSETLLVHWNSFGQMPFRALSVTYVDASRN